MDPRAEIIMLRILGAILQHQLWNGENFFDKDEMGKLMIEANDLADDIEKAEALL